MSILDSININDMPILDSININDIYIQLTILILKTKYYEDPLK